MYCNHFASCGMCGPSLYSKTKETGHENNPPCLAKLVALLLLQPCCECCSSDVSIFHLFSKEKYLFYFDDYLRNCSEMQRINFYHIIDGKSDCVRGFGLRAWIEKKLMIKSYRIAESRQLECFLPNKRTRLEIGKGGTEQVLILWISLSLFLFNLHQVP